MTDLLVTFHNSVPEDKREAVLAEVGAWAGVSAAAPIKPDAKSPGLRRFSYVRVDDAQAEQVANILRDRPEVEAAELAPQRSFAAS